MNNIIGIIYSVVLIVIVIALAELLHRKWKVPAFYTRKIIHIGVANWWFIAIYFFDHYLYPMAGLTGFIIINYFLHKGKYLASMRSDESHSGERSLGTVYYPLSLMLVSFLAFNAVIPFYIGTISVLILGYSDGLAAIFGKRFGRRSYEIFQSTKSIEGSAVFFAVTMIILLTMFYAGSLNEIPEGLIRFNALILFALVMAFIEAMTPKGLDNLSIPVVSMFLLFYIIEGTADSLEYRFLLAVCINLTLAFTAYLKKSVSESGFISGAVLGLVIYMALDFRGWLILALFFIASSMISAYNKEEKKKSISSKGGRRDYIQVIANVAPAAFFAILYAFYNNENYLLAVAITLSAANSDTWASELGILSKKPPVSIITFKEVPKGLSGGVSLTGMVASLAGAFFIALIFYLLYSHLFSAIIILWITLGGMIGSFLDSVFGATIQVAYKDRKSGLITEKKDQSLELEKIKGWPFIDNDMVNFLSISISALVVISFFLYG